MSVVQWLAPVSVSSSTQRDTVRPSPGADDRREARCVTEWECGDEVQRSYQRTRISGPSRDFAKDHPQHQSAAAAVTPDRNQEAESAEESGNRFGVHEINEDELRLNAPGRARPVWRGHFGVGGNAVNHQNIRCIVRPSAQLRTKVDDAELLARRGRLLLLLLDSGVRD